MKPHKALLFGGLLLLVTAAADIQAAEQPAAAAAPATAGAPVKERRPLESVMFTVDEYNDILGRIGSGEETETDAANQAIEDATLYLSAIVYDGPKAWTIWVNGVAVGPDQEFKSFQVTEIGENHVQLLVPLSAQGMRPVRLAPNQTFITKTGTVVEGRPN